MSYFGEFDENLLNVGSFFDEELELSSSGSVFANRLYFPASEAADVSPAFDSGFTSTASAVRRKLAHVKGTSAIAVGSTISLPTATDYGLDRQYVSSPLKAQTILGTTTLKMQLMVREFAASDDVDYVVTTVRVVSNDGSTVKAHLLNFAGYGTVGTEFINAASCRNSICIVGVWDISSNGSYGGGDYTVDEGDRLVVDIGYGCSTGIGTTPQAAAKWGENASDLPEDDSQTTDGAGWIEFSQAIEFQSSGTTQTGAVAYTITVTETAAGNRGATGSVAYNVSLTETAAGNKSAAGAVAYNISLTEAASGGLLVGGAVGYNVSLTETAAGRRIANGAVAYSVSLTETASGVRGANGSVAYNISITQVASGNLSAPPRPNIRGYVKSSGLVSDDVLSSPSATGVVLSEGVSGEVSSSSRVVGVVYASSD